MGEGKGGTQGVSGHRVVKTSIQYAFSLLTPLAIRKGGKEKETLAKLEVTCDPSTSTHAHTHTHTHTRTHTHPPGATICAQLDKAKPIWRTHR